ncbi:Protein argonaute [Cladophialophora chaetospira]|uniref:Protein argonaute n=1 Tax=Cladophialophora chaetospira TaxID=386627 RepID=A0AA38XEG9_9EURO|nr:Protein argonaute [Cladophialophora chaetospira]
MSAARKRGAGRAARGQQPAETASRRGDRLQPGGFDGPASRGSASQSGPGVAGRGAGSTVPSTVSGAGSPGVPAGGFESQAPTASSRRSSQSGGPAPAAAPLGDPARDRPTRFTDGMRNVDLPPSFYNIDQLYSLPTEFAKRPGFNSTGQAVPMNVNAFKVVQYPTVKIYQYDVVIGTGAEKRIVNRKVWESKARKEKTGPQIIWDGSRLAWSLKDYGEIRTMVDLDSEEGRPNANGKNSFRLHIKPTRQLNPSIIQAFLDRRVQMSKDVAEAIIFMDHLLREGPSQNRQFLTVKRSLFKRQGERKDLGGAIEVWRGIYQSMRLAEGHKLIINLDVANTCFWRPQSLTSAMVTKWREFTDINQIGLKMAPAQTNGSRQPNNLQKVVQGALKGVGVMAVYKGNPFPNKEWKIWRFSVNNANQEMLDWKDPTTKQPTGERVSVAQYFRRKYNITLQHPNLLLVEMTKKGVMYPMEFLQIIEGQRYSSKLDEFQTANMIKFAVSRPRVRLDAINEGKKWLNWDGDTYLQNYGLKINNQQIKTQARILPAPGIKFGNRTEQPGTRGRWDLKGKRFLTGNPQELVSWGVGMIPGRNKPDKAQIDNFVLDFAKAYRNHGGTVANEPPVVMAVSPDVGMAVADLHQATGNKFKRRPQLLIFLVQDKQSFNYLRIKKSCDCRFGVVSQVMQIQQVMKGNAQYYSNVLMKVNAKLGGTTSQVLPAPTSGFKSFTAPTMIIGADVSHASPGSQQASMAAITVSFDRFGGRYAASCQTNGHRVEMISDANWVNMLKPLIRQWMSTVGGGRAPVNIYYMRDGVSEGQFEHVLQQEVPQIKSVIKDCAPDFNGKVTVIVASKRHHVRAFPESAGADNNGNPVPGTLIERDVTTPNEFDFYLYSHIALQGTSRPVHYSILHDEIGHKPEQIQNMIYEHCYQYMRSTTSVSLHPAVYYAHLASNRAKAHEDIPASAGPQGGAGFKQKPPSRSSEPSESEVKPLMPLFNVNGIMWSMWYI